jgi:hypothetical protein
MWAAATAAVMALAVGGGAMAGRLWSKDPPPDPGVTETRFEDLPEVRQALADLAAGEEVVLVGGEKRAPYREVWGETTAHEVPTDPGYLGLFSAGPQPSVFEFLPHLPPGQYEISAELRHDTGRKFSRVGLYAGGHAWTSAAGRRLTCAWASVEEWGGPRAAAAPEARAGQGTVQFELAHMAARRGVTSPVGTKSLAGRPFVSAGQLGRPAPFRRVDLVLDGARVRARWEGEPELGSCARPDVARYTVLQRQTIPGGEPLPAEWDVGQGGLGLILFDGQATVRSLRVTPLP